MNICELIALSRNKNKSATNVELFVNREVDLLPVLKLWNTQGSSVTINCLRPTDYFILVFLQDSWMSALQFLLFICIYFVMRFRTYCALVTICSSTSGLSASNWNWYWCFSFWLTSLCIIGSSFIHLIRTDSNVFFSMAE